MAKTVMLYSAGYDVDLELQLGAMEAEERGKTFKLVEETEEFGHRTVLFKEDWSLGGRYYGRFWCHSAKEALSLLIEWLEEQNRELAKLINKNTIVLAKAAAELEQED